MKLIQYLPGPSTESGGQCEADGRRALVEHTNSAAPYEFFDVVDKEEDCSDRHVVRFEHSAELTGLFKVEQNFYFDGCVEQDRVDLFGQRCVGVMQGHSDAQ